MMYKLRTMRCDAEAATGAVWCQKNDARITPVGRWLRALHLDELPQLINVLKGDMALIGPRPERPEFTQRLAVEIPGYLGRLEVRPGITGLAQVNLPPDTDVESVRRKLVLDLMYVREGSIWLDLRILACTCARLVSLKGPRVVRMFGLKRTVPDSDLLRHAAAPTMDRHNDARQRVATRPAVCAAQLPLSADSSDGAAAPGFAS